MRCLRCRRAVWGRSVEVQGSAAATDIQRSVECLDDTRAYGGERVGGGSTRESWERSFRRSHLIEWKRELPNNSGFNVSDAG